MILLTTTLKTRNTKLKRPRIDTNDLLLIALTETRRDVLRTLGESATTVLTARPDLNRGALPMLRDSINAELARRVESQKERAKFGFTDDPDDGQNY